MSKFKVGDTVYAPLRPSGHTKGEIISVEPNGFGDTYYRIDSPDAMHGILYDEEELTLVKKGKPMSKFKVGDRVKRVDPSCDPDSFGKMNHVYTVLSVGKNEMPPQKESIGVIKGKPMAKAECFEHCEEFEDEWHLNDGSGIPEGADCLTKDGSVVAYRKVKKPKVKIYKETRWADRSNGGRSPSYNRYSSPSRTPVNFTYTYTDGELTDIQAEILKE